MVLRHPRPNCATQTPPAPTLAHHQHRRASRVGLAPRRLHLSTTRIIRSAIVSLRQALELAQARPAAWQMTALQHLPSTRTAHELFTRTRPTRRTPTRSPLPSTRYSRSQMCRVAGGRRARQTTRRALRRPTILFSCERGAARCTRCRWTCRRCTCGRCRVGGTNGYYDFLNLLGLKKHAITREGTPAFGRVTNTTRRHRRTRPGKDTFAHDFLVSATRYAASLDHG